MDIQFAEDVTDFFITNERFSHMGDGRGGFGRLTGPDKGSKRALAEFYGRLSNAFEFTRAQEDHFWLAFETLQDEKTRKECVASLQKDKSQAQPQVLGSFPSWVQRLCSMCASSESPAKQVLSTSASSACSNAISESAQVRLCSPKWLPGERLGPVELLCRMYTRIRDDDAPAEVDRPLPRLRSQVSSAAVAAGRAEDASARNVRASAPSGGRNESARPAGRSKVSMVSPPSGSAQQSAMPAAARALAEAVPMPVPSKFRKVRALDSDAPAAQSHAESALADGSDGGQQPVDSTTMPPSAQSPHSPALQQPLRSSRAAAATTDPAPSRPPTQAPSAAKTLQKQPPTAHSHAALASSVAAQQPAAAAQHSPSAAPAGLGFRV